MTTAHHAHDRPETWPGDLPETLRPVARDLCRTMAAIHRRGWCDGTGGNFSVVVKPAPALQLLMAPSGVDKGQVKPRQLILVDGSGAVIGGQGRVSAEMALHRAIVLTTGAGAVLHTHSQAATLLSGLALAAPPGSGEESEQRERAAGAKTASGATTATPGSTSAGGENFAKVSIDGLEMLKGLEGIRTHQSGIDIPVLANDQDLDRLSHAASPLLAQAPHGLLIAGHGLYAWGNDLQQANRHLEILEFLLEQHWRQQLWSAVITRQAS